MPNRNGDEADLAERIGRVLRRQPVTLRASNTRRRDLEALLEEFRLVVEDADPVKRPTSVFSPSDPVTSGLVVAIALVAQPRQPLSGIVDRYGAGVYALYYTGPFPEYAPLSRTEQPIYVGKANPAHPRAVTPVEQGKALSGRLLEHRKSVNVAENLEVADFEYRSLAVQTGLQGAAEERLINLFRPLWNNETRICFGIGKHGDSADRRQNSRSPWDTMHPGRPWATATLSDQKPRSQIVQEIHDHLQSNPPVTSLEGIISQLVGDLAQFGH